MAMSSLEPYGQRKATSPRDARVRDDDERWHVRLTDDDVKLMTLEQLDDAYRLSIVDSETALWKPGMREWQPLRIIAGIEPDEEDEVDVEPEITRVGPTPYDVTPHAPTVPVQRVLPVPKAPLRSSPPPARSTPPPPRLVSMLPPAPVARPTRAAPACVPLARVTSIAAPVAAAPAPVRSHQQVAPQPQAEIPWSLVSVPPVALSVAPVRYPHPEQRSGGFGRLLLGLAFLAGSAVSLYRNDVLLNWARAGHFENQFLSAEQRLLGGPVFGTVRAVATFAPLWEPTSKSAPAAAETVLAAPEANAPRPAAAPSNPPVAREVVPPPAQPKASAIVVPTTEAAPKQAPKPKAEPPARAAAAASRPPTAPTTPRSPRARPATSVATNTPPARSGAKASSSGPAAVQVRLDEEPEATPQPSKSKKAVASVPASVPAPPLTSATGAKIGLDDAIRNAASRKTPKKKKSAADEYDPLNPDL